MNKDAHTQALCLDTPRLVCTQIEAQDRDFFSRLMASNEVQHYISDAHAPEEIEEAFTARLPHWQPGSAHWLCLVVRDRASGERLGVTGYIHREADCAEVGFLFAPEAQGKGYARESLQAVCDFAFHKGGIRRLTAMVTAGNHPSRRLLEKVGFVLEGELRESYWLHNRWHNDWLFGLLRQDYLHQ